VRPASMRTAVEAAAKASSYVGRRTAQLCMAGEITPPPAVLRGGWRRHPLCAPHRLEAPGVGQRVRRCGRAGSRPWRAPCASLRRPLACGLVAGTKTSATVCPCGWEPR
jgi:hypothetical protein